MIKCGSKVKDKITGFTGIVVARTEWLYGCMRLLVQPTKLEKGKVQDTVQFDEDQLELLEQPTPALLRKASGMPAGDRFFRPTQR